MMTDPAAAETIPPASITGRIGKLIVGPVQVWYALECIRYFDDLTHPSLRQGIWIFTGFALWLFPFAINLGFKKVQRWGYRPLWVALAAAAVLAGWDWLRTGSAWGPTVAMFLLALTIYTHLHVGICHLLAAVTGLKGCEMRVIPYYLTKLKHGDESAELCLCPGMWTPIDRWEARLRRTTE